MSSWLNIKNNIKKRNIPNTVINTNNNVIIDKFPEHIKNIIKNRDLFKIIEYESNVLDCTFFNKKMIYSFNYNNYRMFNPSLIVKDINNNFSYNITSYNTNNIYMSYRECPYKYNNNSTVISKINIQNSTIINSNYLFMHNNIGYNEDARFFIYNGNIYISNTYNYNMNIILLDNDLMFKEQIMTFTNTYEKEKNWTFFEKEGKLYSIRYYLPLEIYEINLENKIITKIFSYNWINNILDNNVQLRGGASPIKKDNELYIFLHSSYTYEIYTLVIDYNTFKPLKYTSESLFKDIHTQIKFVCGALYNIITNKWVLSVGIDDMYSALFTISDDELNSKLIDII